MHAVAPLPVPLPAQEHLQISLPSDANAFEQPPGVALAMAQPVRPDRLIVALDRHARLGERQPVAVAVYDLRIMEMSQDFDDAPFPAGGTTAHLARAEPEDGARELRRRGLQERDRLATGAKGVDLAHVRADLGRDDDSFRRLRA